MAMSERNAARYERIADYLRSLIRQANPGDRLPSEAELCRRFSVSRMTARQAVLLVASEGTIERRRGAGTFVRARPVPRDLGSPLSFTDSMEERGMKASSRVLQRGPTHPTEDEMSELGLTSQDGAYVLERLRLADAIPMAIERVVMPVELALSLREGFQAGSLHRAFREVGRPPTEAHAEISARRANKMERAVLGLPPSGIIMLERRTIFDDVGVPLERTETRYAANRYEFRAVLHVPGARK